SRKPPKNAARSSKGSPQRLATDAIAEMKARFADGEEASEAPLAFAQRSVERGINADPVHRVAQALLSLIHDDLDPTWRSRVEAGMPPGVAPRLAQCARLRRPSEAAVQVLSAMRATGHDRRGDRARL